MNNPELDDLKKLWKTPSREEGGRFPGGEMTATHLEQTLARQHRRQRWATAGMLAGQAPVIWLCVLLWRAQGERPLVLAGVFFMLFGIAGMIGLMAWVMRRPGVDLTRATVDHVSDQIAVLRLRRKLAKVYVRVAVALILLGLELFFIDRFWPDRPGWHAAALGSSLAWAALVFWVLRRRVARQDEELAALITELEKMRSDQG